MPPQSGPSAELERCLSALEHAHERAMALIRSIPEPQTAFDAATTLREATDALVGKAADLRALMAQRIWQNERMSIAGLANRIGVSKARAGQLLDTAKAVTADRTEGTQTDV